MSATAAFLELGALALAVTILAVDLIVPARWPYARRAGLFLLAAIGVFGLILCSYALPTPASLTDAFVLDGFALFAKRILLAAVLLTAAGLYPYARSRGFADRSGEALVLILFAAVGG